MTRCGSIAFAWMLAAVIGCGSPAGTTAPEGPRSPAETSARAGLPALDELPTEFGRDAKLGIVPRADFGFDRQLMFVDGGGLLVATESRMELVDPRRRATVDAFRVNSPSVQHRDQTPTRAIWRWDPANHTIVGAVCIGGFGDVVRGLAVWTPNNPTSPTHIPPVDARAACAPLAVSSDATVMFARVGDSTVQRYAMATGNPIDAPIQLPFDPTLAAVSTDGKRIAFAGRHGEVELYDLVARSQRSLSAGGRDHAIRMLAFAPTRAVLVAVGDVGAVAWDLNAATPNAAPIADGVDAVAFSTDGTLLALATSRHVAIVDGATFAAIRTLDITGTFSLAWSPDDSQLAASARMGLVVRDLGARAAVQAVDRDWFDQVRPLPVPPPEPEPAFTRDGSVDGRVLQHGAPVAGVEVELVSGDRWPTARKLPSLVTRTGADGAFHFTSVPRIAWQLDVAPPGMTRSGWIADLRDRKLAVGDVSVDAAVTIRGIVLGPDGRPLAGARVVHNPTYGLGRVETTSAADGSFTIDHLPLDAHSPTPYRVEAWGTDGAVGIGIASLHRLAPPQLAINVASPSDPSVLRVKFIDEHGAPIANANVSFSSDLPHDHTDAAGLASTLLDARTAHAATVTATITLEDGFLRPVDVALPARGVHVVTIQTSAPPGTPLPLECTRYREAIEKLAHCDRVPKPTRDALLDEYLRSSPKWQLHPETIGGECQVGEMTATQIAHLCR